LPIVSADELKQTCVEILMRNGFSREEAEVIAGNIVEANLKGQDGHGVFLLPSYIGQVREGALKPGSKPRIVHETDSTALIDGSGVFGQIAARFGAEIAIEKARRMGVSAVAIRRSGHVGMLAPYSALIAEKGMIGITIVNSVSEVAPYGGWRRLMPTNPICMAFPTSGRPLILDMATSVVAAGKVRARYARHEKTPEGWILDAEGRPTVDPAEFMKGGALLPLGYKGYGLAVAFDILAGVLSGGGLGFEMGRLTNNTFIIAIDIARFLAMEEFKRKVDQLVKKLKEAPPARGFNEILLPGEPEERSMEKRLREGIYIEDDTWRALQELLA
jgi:uncharacterized oxidoreductase